MVLVKAVISAIFLIFLTVNSNFTQERDKINASTQIVTEKISQGCKEIDLGKNIILPTPVYPVGAKTSRIGGSVQLIVIIDEKGLVSGIESVTGHKLLQSTATEAAKQAKFTPTICDGVVIKTKGFITFNFIPLVLTEEYTSPQNIGDFKDLTNDSEFFDSIFFLTNEYKLTFGYADGNFHPNAPLTKGDFLHFLRLTLDLLQKKAEQANKIPLEIGLYRHFNPLKIKSNREISDFDEDLPFAESIRVLVLKYNIAILDEKKRVQGKLPLTQNEVIGFWRKIFGNEAVPVNFKVIKGGNRIFTRGEFALFLNESLYVLTYKTLP